MALLSAVVAAVVGAARHAEKRQVEAEDVAAVLARAEAVQSASLVSLKLTVL